jgi:hypothetical protein
MLKRIETMQVMVDQLVVELEALHQEVFVREGAGAGAGATAQGHPTSEALHGDMKVTKHCNGPIGQLNEWSIANKIEGLQVNYFPRGNMFDCTLSLTSHSVITEASGRSKKEAKTACAEKMCAELLKKYNGTNYLL